MKNLTITGIILFAVSVLLFYLTSPNFTVNELQISHMMGMMAGVGIGLITGGIIGYASKGTAVKEQQRKNEFKQLQKDKAELEQKAKEIVQKQQELQQAQHKNPQV